MSVSVVICSHNGERLLDEAIAAARASLSYAGGGQLVLVDSASTDRTGAIMTAHASGDGVLALRESRRGKSHALNAAIPHLTGDAILYTDDDVVVPEAWVRELSRPLLSGYSLSAGAVHLADDVAERLSDRQREFLADTRYMNLGAHPPRTVVGASMGVSRHVFEAGFSFEPALGPGALGFMEETLLHLQVSEVGGTTAFVGSVPVSHRVDVSRLTRTAWSRRATQQGICEAWIRHHWLHGTMSAREFARHVRSEGRLFERRTSDRRSEEDELDLVRQVASGRWTLRHRFTKRRYPKRWAPRLAPLVRR